MRKIYQKAAYFIMITAFAWVVVGDLVNMHMKLIYHKDLSAHNNLFTKTVSKDKSSYKLTAKDISSANQFLAFINPCGLSEIILPISNIILSQKEFTTTNQTHHNRCNLRGPPTHKLT